MSRWPLVKLGEVLRPVSRPEMVRPDATYKLLGARWYALGLYVKDVVQGSSIQAVKLYRVCEGDFVYNRLFAWKGSFALASQEDEGCFVSNEFPCFRVDPERLDGRYLWRYFSRLPAWNEALGLSTGGTPTSRNRLKEEKLLAMEIPLPPIDEQQRIVARIGHLHSKIDAAKGLRQATSTSVETLVAAEEFRIWPTELLADAPTLEQVTTFLARGRQTKQGSSDHYLIKTQHVQMGRYVDSTITLSPDAAAKVGDEAIARSGDNLIACSAAGCLGRVAFYSGGNRRASTDSHVAIARPNRDLVSPEYLYAYLRGAQGQLQLRSREKGDWKREKVGFRLTELNVADMRKVPVPVPPPAEQRRIVGYVESIRGKVEAMKQLQARTTAELDALLPAILDRAFRGEL